MDKLKAEQAAAYQKRLERIAKIKDEIISDPSLLDDVFLSECPNDRLKFFELIKKLYVTNTTANELYSFQGELRLSTIIDALVELSNHINNMVEAHIAIED